MVEDHGVTHGAHFSLAQVPPSGRCRLSWLGLIPPPRSADSLRQHVVAMVTAVVTQWCVLATLQSAASGVRRQAPALAMPSPGDPETGLRSEIGG